MVDFKNGDEVCLKSFPDVRMVVINDDYDNVKTVRYMAPKGFADTQFDVDDLIPYQKPHNEKS